jgi:cellulose synthase/poly-beta-1,6-N-acetylglucosamine synthase-like glycosyltransferase
MWKCECGEFNNDEHDFCVQCQKVRLTPPEAQPAGQKELSTRGMFRRMQEFILFDIAFCAMIALYCVFVEYIDIILPPERFGVIEVPESLKTTLPIVAVILFQVLLVVNILRMVYSVAVNAERNRLFLERIHRLLTEKKDEGKSRKE